MPNFNIFMKRASVLSLAVILSACNDSEGASTGSATTDNGSEMVAGVEGPTISNRVDIPVTVRKNLGITFVEVEKRAVKRTLRIPGEFEYLPQAHRNYHVNLEGQLELKVKILEKVTKGQLLYTINSPNWFKVKQELLRVSNDIRSAETTLKLANQNSKTHIATAARQRQNLLLEAASLYTGLSIDELKREVKDNGTKVPYWQTISQIQIRAISNGFVKLFEVTNGEWASVGDHVLSVVDPSKMRFKGHALQRDVPSFKAGQKVTIVAPEARGVSMQETISGELIPGVFTEIDQRTFSVYSTLDTQPSWARVGIGSYMEVVQSGSSRKKLAIPKSAIVRDGLVDVFFRRDTENPDKAIRVEADLGTDDGRWVVVKSGLRRGDQVVLNGVYELNIASSMSGKDLSGGHFHSDGTFHAGED